METQNTFTSFNAATPKDPFCDMIDLLDDILAHPDTGITPQTLEALKNYFLELKATGLIPEDMTIKAYFGRAFATREIADLL